MTWDGQSELRAAEAVALQRIARFILGEASDLPDESELAQRLCSAADDVLILLIGKVPS